MKRFAARLWRSRLNSGARQGAHSSSRGQALVEFALVVPLFLLLLFGVIEYSLINASIGAFNFAAKDGARYGAIIGEGTAPGNSDLDTYIVNNVILPRVNGVVIAKGTEIDIYNSTVDGVCTVNPSQTGSCQEDIWRPQANGTWARVGSNGWLAGQRLNSLSDADYLAVSINYTYTYLTAFFAITSPNINLSALSVQRIEPQQYGGDRHNPNADAIARAAPASAPAPLASLAPLGPFGSLGSLPSMLAEIGKGQSLSALLARVGGELRGGHA